MDGAIGHVSHSWRRGLGGDVKARGANGRCFCGRDAVILAAVSMKTINVKADA